MLGTVTAVCLDPCLVLQLPAEVVHEAVYLLERSKHRVYYQLLRAGLFRGVEEKLINKLLKDQHMKVYRKKEEIRVTKLNGCFVVLEGEVNILIDQSDSGRHTGLRINNKRQRRFWHVSKMGPGASSGFQYFQIRESHPMFYFSS